MNFATDIQNNLSLTVFYDESFYCENSLHNITAKKQHLTQTDIAFEGDLMAGYELEYNYSKDKPHQLSYIADENYRATDSLSVAERSRSVQDAYMYDANGNQIYINTSDSVQTQAKERTMLWDEENRLRAINDNGYISSYFYDAA
ncbi:MAG: hypothetical protein ACK5LR_00335, partial [Mangrovibacterium sp.]